MSPTACGTPAVVRATHRRLLAALLPVLVMALAAWGPSAPQAQPLTADNVRAFQPVAQVDFASLPSEAGLVESGSFITDARGARLAVRNRSGEVVTIDPHGDVLDVFAVSGSDGLPDTVLDMAFNPTGNLLAALVSDGAEYAVAVRDVEQHRTAVRPFINSPDVPLRVWFEPDSPFVWLEVASSDPRDPGYTARLAYALPGQVVDRLNLFVVPGGPASDAGALTRFGRISPPLAITSSAHGLVKLWNLETAHVIHEVAVEEGLVPVFGGLSPDGVHLAWRDPDLQALHLLNLESGEDRVVADLNGEYASFIFVPDGAEVILGVHVDGEPRVIAWEAATGARLDLGEYRPCGRPPDMARLTSDSAALVIGCDRGLEIWRVADPMTQH